MTKSLLAWAVGAHFALSGISYAGDFDGIWYGGYAQGNGQVTMQADFVGDLVRFDIEMRRWGPDKSSGKCQYYSRVSPDAVGTIILNVGSSANYCVREGEVTVNRANPSTVSVNIIGISSISEFELNEVIRPINNNEYAALPPNFNVLELTIGMTRTEIESRLIKDRGYVHIFDQDINSTTANWQSDIITYRKGEADTENDIIKIAYSARPNGVPEGDAYAVMIHREANLGKASRLHVDALRNSLSEKYGAPTQGDSRRYGRNGMLVRSHNETTQFCEMGNRQSIEYRVPFDSPREFKSHCGSELHVSIVDDRATGLVTRYRLTLTSVDYLNNDFWLKLGTDRAAEFSAFLDAVTNAETSGPEL